MLDSHRPYDHHNVNEDRQRVIVIHDGCRSLDEYPSLEDDRIREQIGDDNANEDEDSEYDSEADNSEQQEALRELEELKDREEGHNGVDDDNMDLAERDNEGGDARAEG